MARWLIEILIWRSFSNLINDNHRAVNSINLLIYKRLQSIFRSKIEVFSTRINISCFKIQLEFQLEFRQLEHFILEFQLESQKLEFHCGLSLAEKLLKTRSSITSHVLNLLKTVLYPVRGKAITYKHSNSNSIINSDSSDDERVSRSWRSAREIREERRKKEEEETLQFKPMKVFNVTKQNVANAQEQLDKLTISKARQLFEKSNKEFKKLAASATYVDTAPSPPPKTTSNPLPPSLVSSSSPTLSRSSSTATLVASDGEWDEISNSEVRPLNLEYKSLQDSAGSDGATAAVDPNLKKSSAGAVEFNSPLAESTDPSVKKKFNKK